MEHLNGISEEQYIYGINAAWQLYKKLQHNFPARFKEYIADSKWKIRLSYNIKDDRWYLLKVSFPNGIMYSHLNLKSNDNSNSNSMRRKNPTSITDRSNRTLRYLLKR